MEGRDFKTFALLVAFVLTTLCCCLGTVQLNRNCEARGGHFEIVWNNERFTCVGGQKR